MPNGMTLGGTVANFTVMAGRLGNHAAILSRIGRDDLGRLAVDWLDPLPVDTSFLEVDPVHETGRVTVNLPGRPAAATPFTSPPRGISWSSPTTGSSSPSALMPSASAPSRSAAVESRQTIQTLVAQAPSTCIRVFDVNLRAPFYRRRNRSGIPGAGHRRENERRRSPAGPRPARPARGRGAPKANLRLPRSACSPSSLPSN